MLTDDPFAEFRSGLEDPERRRRLLQLLTCGALGLSPWPGANAFFWDSSPQKLAAGKSIHSLEGEVWVNGRRADENTRIRAGDTVRTGAGGEIVFAVGADAFLLRSASELQISGSDFFVDSLRILTGRLLSVFARRKPDQQLSLRAATATIGIRGTGVYVESEPEQTYVCTCYGKAALASNTDPNDRELITSKNHDQPRFIRRDPGDGGRIREAPVINHDNSELKLLEAIVGRDVPAGFGKQSYKK
jgi:hypothetical protein